MSLNSSKWHFYNRENFRSDKAIELYLYDEEVWEDRWWDDPWSDDDYVWCDWIEDLEYIKERDVELSILMSFEYESFVEDEVFEEKLMNGLKLLKKRHKKFVFSIDI